MKIRSARSLAFTAGAVLVVSMLSALGTQLGAQQANAAPVCTEAPLPPACLHTPTPKPTPPATLESVGFSPTPGEENYFWVQMEQVTRSAIASYPDGALTPFSMSISCTNGYFHSAPMAAKHANDSSGTGSYLLWSVNAPANAAAGTCYATTWDQLTLGMRHTVLFSQHTTAPGTFWTIEFGPNSWAPQANSN